MAAAQAAKTRRRQRLTPIRLRDSLGIIMELPDPDVKSFGSGFRACKHNLGKTVWYRWNGRALKASSAEAARKKLPEEAISQNEAVLSRLRKIRSPVARGRIPELVLVLNRRAAVESDLEKHGKKARPVN